MTTFVDKFTVYIFYLSHLLDISEFFEQIFMGSMLSLKIELDECLVTIAYICF